LPLAE